MSDVFYRFATAAAASLAAAVIGAGAAAQSSPVVPPPPDYAEVLAQELQVAVDSNSSAALINFIARHPDEALTEHTRQLLVMRGAPDPAPGTGPDDDIYAAFDAARRARDPAALEAFAIRYANHPLAAEARRGFWAR